MMIEREGLLDSDLTSPWGGPVIWKRSTSSTMINAFELATSGCPHGTVVVADHQSLGVGRGDERRWVCRPRRGLLFSVVLMDTAGTTIAPFSSLPLRVGLGIQSAMTEFIVGCQVKWPNDLIVRNRKVAGVLCRHRSGVTAVGVGINCNQKHVPHSPPDGQTQANLDEIAVSLRMLNGRKCDRRALLRSVLAGIAENLQRMDWRQELCKNLWRFGEHVQVDSTETIVGTIEGIGEYGELLIRCEQTEQLRAVASGTVRLR